MRVMTFNIRGGKGMDGRCSLARIVQTVQAHAPDVVCFQEIHERTPWRSLADQPCRLQRLLGMPLIFQRNLNIGFGGEGVGIATSLPIEAVARHALPSVRERRGLLEVRVRSPHGVVSLFCTHWGLGSMERLHQAEETTRRIVKVGHPVIVCGDLNDRADQGSVRHLIDNANLLDVGAAANALTYPADHPRLRIDYILCSKQLAVAHVETVQTQSSDHYPVLATIM